MRNSNRWLGLVTLLAVLSLVTTDAQTRSQPAAPSTKKLALVGGMLLDGYEVPPVHHAAILIEGNKIIEVGRAADIKIPPDATVIDTTGRTMMPGLMDLHVHLMILGHGNYGVWFPWLAKTGVQRVMEISAKQLVNAGITTAVDLAAPLKESLLVRDRINRGEIPGPRMLVSGPWITLSLGNYPPELGFQVKVTTPEEAAAETEKLAQAEKIPVWLDVVPDDTSTDGDGILLSRAGVPFLLLELPLRYMHTTVACLHRDVIAQSGKLLAHFLRDITSDWEDWPCI